MGMTLLTLLVFACAGDRGPAGGGGSSGTTLPGGTSTGGGSQSGQAWTLTVSGGYGSGNYQGGSAAHVWADVDPHAAIVTGWTTDTDVLADPLEWNSSLVMPQQDLVLTPTILEVPFDIRTQTLSLGSGARAYSLVSPSEPVGIVLFFHGASYSRAELDDAAASSVGMALVHAGYAVAALDSEAAASAGAGGWNADPKSTDMANVRALAAALRSDLGDLPVYAWGMSSGGQFAHLVGAELPAQGVLGSCAPGTADIASRTTAPTAWFLAAADTVFTTGATDAPIYAKQLQARGLQAQVNVHPTTPLYDERFTRVPGVDADTSAAIADWIRQQGYVDAQGQWLASGRTVSSALQLPDLDADTVTAVRAEIEIMAADHELYDDYTSRMVAFLQALSDD
ncbi:MAG: hypothetical protein GXP62_18800 [Oligoflexia bacterium]|nr:hypothetical protein [Oligoflexia bacterium]